MQSIQSWKAANRLYKAVVALGAVVALSSVLSACGGDSEAGAADDGGKGVPIDIFLSTSNADWAYHVAAEKGYFADEGLNVKLTGFNSGADAASAFTSQGAEMVQVGDLPSVVFAAKGGVTTLADTTHLDHGVILIVPNSVKEPSQLKGKKIGAALTSSPGFWIKEFLADNDLTGDVESVNLANPDQAAALVSGGVDALITFPATATTLLASGDFHILDQWETGNYLMTSDKFLVAHPDAAAGVLKALSKASEFIGSDTSEAAEIEAKTNGITADAVKEWLDEKWGTGYTPRFTDDDVSLLNGMLDWAVSTKLIEAPVELCSFVDTKPIQSAFPTLAVSGECKS